MLIVIGWIIWAIITAYGIGAMFNKNKDAGVRSMMKTQGLVMLAGAAITLVFPVSKFHMIWIVVGAFFVPMLLLKSKANNATKKFERMCEESKRTGIPLNEIIDKEVNK